MLSNKIIQNHQASYQINSIAYKPIKRYYEVIDDVFKNPYYVPLKKVICNDPRKYSKIKFNIFNRTNEEYQFEIFELEAYELREFEYYLKQYGYSSILIKRFRTNVVPN